MKTKLLFAIFWGILILSTFIISGVAEDSTDLFINEITEKINENDLYLGFISESKYNAVKLVAEENIYYFIYEKSVVKIVDICKPDVVVKLSSKEFDKIVEAYENNDLKKLKKMIFKALPFRVKWNTLFQCLKTDWCKEMIF